MHRICRHRASYIVAATIRAGEFLRVAAAQASLDTVTPRAHRPAAAQAVRRPGTQAGQFANDSQRTTLRNALRVCRSPALWQ